MRTQIILALTAAVSPAAAQGSGVTAPDAGRPNVMVAASALDWIHELPADPHRLVKLSGDRSSGQAGILLKLPGNFDSGWHAHTADYRAIVISGTWVHVGQDPSEGAGKRLTPGSYWTRRRDEMHKDECVSAEGCVIFVFSDAKLETYFPRK